MLVAERHREIVSVVDKKNSIRVTELAKMFNVTEETIRRDLEKLESQGKLLRSHGGAVSVKNIEVETPFSERQIAQVEEKAAIAKEAVKRITEGDVIILDASTTAWQIAQLLPDMNVTVITNAIKVAVELASLSNVRVISTGGTLSPLSLSYVGPLAERSLESYHANKVFFSCKGIDLQTGISDSNEWQALLKKRMINIADERYLLVDHSKFGVKALAVFGQLSNMSEIITDHKAPMDIVNKLRGMDISVTLVNNVK